MRGRPVSILISVTILMLIIAFIAPGGGVAAADRKTQSVEWRKSEIPTTEDFYSVFALDSNHVWAGSRTNIWFFNGVSWTNQCSTAASVMGIWGTDANHIWAVSGSRVLFWDGQSWSTQFTGTDTYTDITGLDRNHLWACGDNGKIASMSGVTWTETATPGITMQAISACAVNDVWAVGGNAKVIHFNGSTWSSVTPPAPGKWYYGVAAIDAGNVWVSGASSTGPYHYNGSSWQNFNVESSHWTVIRAFTPSDILFLSSSYVFYYDGSSFMELGGTIPGSMEDMSVASDAGIWLAGMDGVYFLGSSTEYFFAEGTCRPGFDAYYCIQNPQSQEANVTLTYMKGDGTTTTDQVTVNPGSRSTVYPRNKLGTGDDAAHDFSTQVECTNGPEIIVERPTYFNYMGATRNNWNGGHDAMGAFEPDEAVGFAEGSCRPGFDTYFCVQNPGSASADVTITFLLGDGDTAERKIKVPAHARATVKASDTLGTGNSEAWDFSSIVECTNGGKIIVERPMYFSYGGGHAYNWTGGSDVMGSDVLVDQFYFAEGTCRPGFDTYFCMMNPGEDDANVTFTYMKGDGTTVTQQVVLPWCTRMTVVPREKLGTGDDAAHDFSTKVVSDQPILVERPMYFNYNGGRNLGWNGGHDVMGAMETAQAYAFAEGTARPGFDTYFCIQNPGDASADVKLVYMRGTGEPVEQNVSVQPHSRQTIRPRDTLGVADDAAHDFSTLIFSTNDQEIVVERPMYFDYCSNYNYQWTGGSDVVGMPGQVASAAAAAQGKSTAPAQATFSSGQQPEGTDLGDLLKAKRN